MDTLMKHLQEAVDKKKEMEHECARLQRELLQRQRELQAMGQEKDSSAKRILEDTVENVKADLRELEKRLALQTLKHEEVLLEMEALKMRSRHSVENSNFTSSSYFDDILGKERLLMEDVVVPSQSGYGPYSNWTQLGTPALSTIPSYLPMQTNLVPPARFNNTALRPFVAKYSYDPYSQSPNDNPELELPLKAGDYIIVRGDMDEDGFYFGELINGRQGYIPSNFVQMIEMSELGTELSQVLNTWHLTGMVPSVAPSYHQPLDLLSDKLPHVMLSNMNQDFLDVEEAVAASEVNSTFTSLHHTSTADSAVAKYISPPRQLTLERLLSSSLVISWLPPLPTGGSMYAESCATLASNFSPITSSAPLISGGPHPLLSKQTSTTSVISSVTSMAVSSTTTATVDTPSAYHIYVNGQFRMAISANDKTKAVLDGIEFTKVYRVSVRVVTMRGQSHDEQCTVLISAADGVIPMPSRLKAGQITSTTARLRWMPGDSNCAHTVLLNGHVLCVCAPTQYKILITGLTPDYLHKVSIRAELDELHNRNVISQAQKKRTTASLELRTLPIGAPESPMGVVLDSGTHAGDVLVSWSPIALESNGLSNGLRVVGYRLYVNGVCVHEVLGASVDHTFLHLSCLQTLGNQLVATSQPANNTSMKVTMNHEDSAPSIVETLQLMLVMRTIAVVPSSSSDLSPHDIGSQASFTSHLMMDGIASLTSSHPSKVISVNATAVLGSNRPSNVSTNTNAASSAVASWSNNGFPALPPPQFPSGALLNEVIIESSDSHPPCPLPVEFLAQVAGTAASAAHMIGPELAQRLRLIDMSQEGTTDYPYSSSNMRPLFSVAPTFSSNMQPTLTTVSSTKSSRPLLRTGASSPPVPHSPTALNQPIYPNNIDIFDQHTHSFDETLLDSGVRQRRRQTFSQQRVGGHSVSLDESSPHYESAKNGGGETGNGGSGEGGDQGAISHRLLSQGGGSPSGRRNLARGRQHSLTRHRSRSNSPRRRHSQHPSKSSHRNKNYERSPQVGHSPTQEVDNEAQPQSKVITVPEIHITKDTSFSDEDNGTPRSKSQREGPSLSSRTRGSGTTPASRGRQSSDRGYPENSSRTRGGNSGYWRNDSQGDGGAPDEEYSGSGTRPPPSSSHQPSQPRSSTAVRTFVATFDYDPATMSPNVDSHQELVFRKSQYIRVFGDCDEDGFYWGECNGRRGLVPRNMVQEVTSQQPRSNSSPQHPRPGSSQPRPGRGVERDPGGNVRAQSQNPVKSNLNVDNPPPQRSGVPRSGRPGDNGVNRSQKTPSSTGRPPRGEPQVATERSAQKKGRYMVAQYDYDPRTLSPNVDAEAELAFREGDVILVLGDMNEDGFYYGEIEATGQRGLVPSNFLQELPPSQKRHRSRPPPEPSAPTESFDGNPPVSNRPVRGPQGSTSGQQGKPTNGGIPTPSQSQPRSAVGPPNRPVPQPQSRPPPSHSTTRVTVEEPRSLRRHPLASPSPAAVAQRLSSQTSSEAISDGTPTPRQMRQPLQLSGSGEDYAITAGSSFTSGGSLALSSFSSQTSQEAMSSSSHQNSYSNAHLSKDDDMPVSFDQRPSGAVERKKKLSLLSAAHRRGDEDIASDASVAQFSGGEVSEGALERKRSVFKNPKK